MGDAVGYQDQHDPIPTQSAAVEDALGSVLDKVQDSLQFPSGSALKPSLSYGYGFQTQLYFTLEPKWEILPQLALQWVRFDVSISKTRHYSGTYIVLMNSTGAHLLQAFWQSSCRLSWSSATSTWKSKAPYLSFRKASIPRSPYR